MRREVRIDVRHQSQVRIDGAKRSTELCFKINHTMPTSPECKELVSELFNHTLGENTVIHPPMFLILADKVKIGKNVVIMNNFQCMSDGGLTIDDNARISLNSTIATNNHDFYERDIISLVNLSISRGMLG